MFSAVGAPTTSAGMLGDITMGFGVKFSREGGAASTVSSKFLEFLGHIWELTGNVLHSRQ